VNTNGAGVSRPSEPDDCHRFSSFGRDCSDQTVAVCRFSKIKNAIETGFLSLEPRLLYPKATLVILALETLVILSSIEFGDVSTHI